MPVQASGCIQCWALTLGMYNYRIVHKRSTDHTNADALSRLPLHETIMSTPLPSETVLLMEQLDDGVVTAGMICAWTRKDPILSRVTQYVLSGWPCTMTEQSSTLLSNKLS